MTQQAFVIDQTRCIGCHACTVACKVEHGVELGVFRTWVKYIERGEFPDVRRHFSVMRCNHCTDAPCVEVCPVGALHKREDGIVDFNSEQCIGCKACLNACPYDSLYIDPNSHTAAKCNFCAHRVELDLKPACEVVCPTGAIISGDIHDPASEVSRLLGTAPSSVRNPEQGTGPNVYYVGADAASLDPLAAGADAYLTTELPKSQHDKLRPLKGHAPATATMDIEHPPPWGWKVSSYFLSKGVGAGAMMLTSLLLLLGAHGSGLADIVPGVLALAGIAVTGVFLVWDLKQPRRFYYLFTRPQWRSWLARGAQVINVAALLGFVFTLAAIFDWSGPRDVLRWALIPAGAMLAGYTAFLFNQCEGRDLWQSPLLLPHTIINALIAGASTLGIAAVAVDAPAALPRALGWTIVLGVAASAGVIALDTFGRHPTKQAERAARNLYRSRIAWRTAEWGWEEVATPTYARTHVHHSLIDHDVGEYVLVPTYRLPQMIHTRSGNAKYLTELAHAHPLLVCPEDAERIGVETNDLVRVETEIGWFVIKAFVTQGIRPGVIAASHHMGRWRLREDQAGERWSTALVDMQEAGETVTFRRIHGVQPWQSSDRSSSRVWWNDAGVHQNITFPVHPDPISGMHCWHQKVRARRAQPGDRYADIHVDHARARMVYRKWRSLARPAIGELRRPIWLFRPLKPVLDAYRLPDDEQTRAARAAADTERPSPSEFHKLVDWSPEKEWGPLDG